ncbi:hypothetical protein [Paracoccus lutimaris]|uniref:Glycosyl transferase family 2 n=1 Tax=Paracoccus lutimaris TaxID=1490030 RepID=A0A368Z7A0_9RHOB|nr:hypothetical protein [Paracoccus lutimaris]RCW88293.1 hypothetical protein DFP89_102223 [Paracoccus lutimaris]
MSIAFVTMVYNDEFFLDVWLRHYLKYTAPENLYVITHGPQPYAHEMARGCNVIEIDRDPRNPRLDQDRFAHLSKFCSELTASYDRVIWNDVDEIILLDPKYGSDLIGYMESIPRQQQVITPLGLEIVHRADLESDYDYGREMFAQRRYVRFNGWYTKPNITGIPIIWGPDGHGSSHDQIHLDDRLYTFHLKWFDQSFHINRHRDRLKLRFNDDDGNEVIVGAGSWAWSESTYLIISNSFLRMNVLPPRRSFDFGPQRELVRSSFRGGSNGMYRISWSVDGTLHHLPERFVGMI